MNNSTEQGSTSSLSNTNNPQNLNQSSLVSQAPSLIQSSVQNNLLDSPSTNLVVQSPRLVTASTPLTTHKITNTTVFHTKKINYPSLFISVLFILIAISLYAYNRKKNKQHFN